MTKKKIVSYFVYASGEFEGETKTLAGAQRMAAKVGRMRNLQGRPYVPEIKASVVEQGATRLGDRSWLEPIEVGQKTKRQLDAEIAEALIPSIGKWSMTAGGSSAAEGKHGYTFTAPEGTYHVWPVSSQYGRHIGYGLKFSATGGRPKGTHGGLWHDLGMHRSPQVAIKAAKEHHAKGFE